MFSSAGLAPTTISTQLVRFDRQIQKALHETASAHERVAQLALSFPVLFYALATGYGDKSNREKTLALAVEGRPVAELAAVIGLPLCFRRLPPEACVGPLLHVLWSDEATRRFGSLLPADPQRAASWLRGASIAALACDEEFAHWFVCQDFFRGRRHEVEQAALVIGIFAWHSKYAASDSPLRPSAGWRPDLQLETALARTAAWLVEDRRRQRMRTVQIPGKARLQDHLSIWKPPTRFDAFEFVPLLTRADVTLEGKRMKNCLASYADDLDENRCRLFSMRRHGKRVASVEVACDEDAATLVIRQMRASCNLQCQPDIVEAAEQWLEQSLPTDDDLSRVNSRTTLVPVKEGDQAVFRKALAPYAMFLKNRYALPAQELQLASLKRAAKAAYHCAVLACHDGLHFGGPRAAFRDVPDTTRKKRHTAAGKSARFLNL